MHSARGAQHQRRNGMSGSVPPYTCMPPKYQCCLGHVCVPPQNQRRLSRISTRNSRLLARTSPDTLCQCVCHGSAPLVVGCGNRQGKRCGDAGSRMGDGQPPPPMESMTAGEAGRALVALLTDLYFEAQARCPFDRLAFDCSLQFNGQG